MTTKDIEVTTPDGQITIDIPEGTTAKTGDNEPIKEITIGELCSGFPPPPAKAYVVGCAYDFGPDGATFDPPIKITISYDPGLVPEGVAEKDMVIAYYDVSKGKWIELPSTVDTINHTITAEASGFSLHAVYVPAPEATPIPTVAPTPTLKPTPTAISTPVPTVAPTPTPTPVGAAPTNIGLILGPTLAALVVIALLAYLFVFRRRHKYHVIE